MSTNVPDITWTNGAPVLPSETDILDGRLADINSAFGGGLDEDLSTPQGQLAQSDTAIIGDKNTQIAYIANMVNPASASGQWQDALGYIYLMSRTAGSGTVVSATCVGAVGTVIPAGSIAQDTSGYLYKSTADATIGSSGSVTVSFQNETQGAIACAAGTLTTIYSAVAGWDTVTNPSAGTEGSSQETRSAFELRRQDVLASNAQGIPTALLGAMFGVDNVLDAYVISNGLSTTSGASFTGSISGSTLTVTSLTSGTIATGQMVSGSSVAQSTVIMELGSGTGGTGTYQLNNSQTVASSSMTSAQGGVQLAANSVYVGVYGGASSDIAAAIFKKIGPGCNMNGNTTVTYQDTGPTDYPYSEPYPSYQITYNIPTATPILFNISMQNNSGVPSDAVTQVQNAVIESFNGEDGGTKARMGAWIFASRFVANIQSLGSWALIYQIQVGISSASLNSVLMQINQVPTISASNITVSFS